MRHGSAFKVNKLLVHIVPCLPCHWHQEPAAACQAELQSSSSPHPPIHVTQIRTNEILGIGAKKFCSMAERKFSEWMACRGGKPTISVMAAKNPDRSSEVFLTKKPRLRENSF